jgi:hypothetical protein
MPAQTNNRHSRRDFLKGTLIVSFAAQPLSAQGPFDTHESHIDPKKLDSWLAVAANGLVTAHTGKCDFGQASSPRKPSSSPRSCVSPCPA